MPLRHGGRDGGGGDHQTDHKRLDGDPDGRAQRAEERALGRLQRQHPA
ncbi:MAG: hypothetical protein ACRDYV_18295 [Acidimicrobiia bacterium]